MYLFCIGKKSSEYFSKRDFNVKETFFDFWKDMNYETASDISNSFIRAFEQNDIELQIELYRGSKGGMLFAPDKTNMVEKVKEYLDAKIKFKLRKGKETIIEGNSSSAALEIIGDTKSLIDNFK